ncbi:MAG: DUF4268 domain-containing protein [Nitrospirae bacterium]|nr:DUF4268 domain-containing protein [Nitrospirota bacterium]
MYLIDKNENRITQIPTQTFSDLGFKEREHLQEWFANNPGALGEELLIIQKEFSGFNDTNERLDLLALDKDGNIVIIENKLDDTGRDVTWQALKYASYCSSLTKEQIRDIYQTYLNKQGDNQQAVDSLVDFFDNAEYEELSLNKGHTQRIILIAGNFRKEVTSTVLWLMNYNLRIQCFRVTPFKLGDQLFLDVEQIVPTKGTEDYVIKMADKNREDITTQEEMKNRHYFRLEFWNALFKVMNAKSEMFRNVSPSKSNWIVTGAGVSGVGLTFVISHSFARTELYMARPSKEDNKLIFDELKKHESEIEAAFGDKLEWERLDDKKASRIKFELKGVDVFNKDDWPKMVDFMVDGMIRMEKAFKEHLARINKKLKSKELKESIAD